MSRRTSIVVALSEKIKTIDGTGPYQTNLQNQCFPKLKFWDEVNDFPSVYLSPGTELREYHPADFAWGLLAVCVKVYCKSEDNAQEQLEQLLEDLEHCIDSNRRVVYDSINNYETTEILIDSITTDEGLLAPYAVGEINLQVRYQIM
jgi:translation elongation factor EF-1beta